jgi:DNA-binding response OmpR family regulator
MRERTNLPLDILIVDDSSTFVELVSLTLGFRAFRHAFTLEQALAMIDDSAPEVVMLDLSLPDSPVAQTLSRIREIKDRAQQATIIIVTGYPDQNTRTLAMDQGADRFLSKNAGGFFNELSASLLAAGVAQRCANESTVEKVEAEVKKIVAPDKP